MRKGHAQGTCAGDMRGEGTCAGRGHARGGDMRRGHACDMRREGGTCAGSGMGSDPACRRVEVICYPQHISLRHPHPYPRDGPIRAPHLAATETWGRSNGR